MPPLKRQSVREQIKTVLLDRILSGEYGPGHRLRELELASEFGTSQGPVREALRELAAQRLIETEPNRGSHVRAVPAKELVEVYVARQAIEGMACELLPEDVHTPPGSPAMSALQDIAHRTFAAADAGDALAYTRADAEFHRTIVELSGNSVLLRLWDDLRMNVRNRALVQRVGPSTELLTYLADQHFGILAKLEAHDTAAAADALRAHLADVAHEIRRTTLGENLAPLIPGDTKTGAGVIN